MLATAVRHAAATRACALPVSPAPREWLQPSPLTPGAPALPALTPDDTEFVVLSFEGPDPYCRAGGLGVRATELTRALAERGFTTHFYFVGDPVAPGEERLPGLSLTYHRWCQWLSRHHPAGVYDGERAKLDDFRASIPPRLLEH